MKPEVFTLEGNIGRHQLEAERKKLEAAAAAAEAKAAMFAKARAPLTGKSHGVQQRELFGGDLFTNPRKKKRGTPKRRPPPRRKQRPSRQKRRAPTTARTPRQKRRAARVVFHAFAHDRKFDIYRLTSTGAKLVARNVTASSLKSWAKKAGATIKSGRRA